MPQPHSANRPAATGSTGGLVSFLVAQPGDPQQMPFPGAPASAYKAWPPSLYPPRLHESVHPSTMMDPNGSSSSSGRSNSSDALAPPPASHRLRGLHPRIPTDARIGVVGGGPSGLAAAWALERLGYQNVTVLEQHHSVGGMCETLQFQGRMYDLGGQVLAMGRSPTMGALQEEVGAELEDLSEHKQMLVAADGAVQELNVFKDFVQIVPVTAKLQAEVSQQQQQRIGVHAVSSLASEASAEYLARRARLPVVPVSVAATFTGSGYGYPVDIPYAYLHEFSRTALLGKVRRVRGGYASLWQKLAATLSDVRCNARVTQILRPDDGRVTVRGTDTTAGDGEGEASSFEMQFDKVIVTGSLPFRNCATYRSDAEEEGEDDVALELTGVEKRLFAKVRTVEYYTTVVEIEGLERLPAGFFYFGDYIADPSSMGHPVAMQRFFPDTDVFLFWSYGNAHTPADKVTGYIYEDVQKMLKGTVKKLILQRKWTYFPHVNSQDMKAGFYDELGKLQGQNNTYYAGGLWAFELTERNAAYSMEMVAHHFGSTQLVKPYVKRLIQVPYDERKYGPTAALPGYNVDRLPEMPGIQFPDLPSLDAYLHFYANHEVTKDKVLYTWLDDQGKETDSRTYADLNLRASIIAHRLLSCKSDIKAGDRVLLLHPPGLEFVEAFFGCLRAGVLAVPLIPPDPSQGSGQALLKVENVARASAAKAILATSSYHAAVRAARLASRITSRCTTSAGRWPNLAWYYTDSWARSAAGTSSIKHPKWSSWLLDRIPTSKSLSPVASFNGHSSTGDGDSSSGGSPKAHRFSRPPPSPRRLASFNSSSSSSSTATSGLNSNQQDLSWSPTEPSDGAGSEAKETGYSSDSSSSESPELYEFEAPKPDDVCFLQFTSGSTGESKGVMITHRALVHNVKLMRRVYQSTSRTVLISWLPQYHDMGLIGGLFTALLSGGTAVLFSPTSFIKKPLLWMETMSRYRGTHSAGPNFAFELMLRRMDALESTGKPVPKFDLSALRFLMISAEPVRHQTLSRFLQRFRDSGLREQIMAPGYGLAENCVFVCTTYGHKRPIYVDSENRVCCGFVERDNADIDIRIVSPETGMEVEEGKEGEIWLSSPSAATGYWGLPELSQETFYNEVSTARRGRRFLRTGDLGRVIGDALFVTGRIKDLIIVAGRNIYPSDIEKTVESCSDALRPGCSAAFGAPVAALQQQRSGRKLESAEGGSPDDVDIVIATEVRDERRVDPELVGKIKAAVAAEHGVEVAHVRLLKPRTIAKTTSGKIRRLECLQRFLDGSLQGAKPNMLVNPRSPRARRMRRSESAPLIMSSASFSNDLMAASTGVASRPSKEEIKQFLVQIVADRTGLMKSQISEEESLSSYNVDSVAVVWAASKLSDFLGVQVAAIDIYTAGCIAELADMADALLSNQVGPAAVHVQQSVSQQAAAVSAPPAASDGTGVMSEREIENHLVTLVAERTGLPAQQISTTDALTSYGIDSVGVVWAAQKLSQFLGIHIAAIDIYTGGSIAELTSLALELLKKAGPVDAANRKASLPQQQTHLAAVALDTSVEEEIETELIPDAELESALEPSERRKLVVTGLQVLGILYIAALFLLPAFVVYGKLAGLISVTAESGAWGRFFSLGCVIGLLPLAWLAYLGLTALSIAFFATTLLRPNYSIQTAIPLWSLDYVKWWVLYRLCDFASNHVVGIHLRGTVFLSYWYRLLGAQIGSDVFLDTTDITDPLLLYVGNGAVIGEGATIQSHDVRGGIVRFRPVRIGTGAVVGPYSMVQQGTIVDAGARISALGKTLIGEKVVRKQDDPEEVQSSTKISSSKQPARELSAIAVAARQIWGLYLVGLVSTVSAMVAYVFFLWVTRLLGLLEDPMDGLSSTVQSGFFWFPVAATLPWALAGLAPLLAFHDPGRIINFLDDRVATPRGAFLIIACSAASYMVYGLALATITCALKWQLISNVLSQRAAEDGPLPVNSDLGLRIWLVHRLITAAHMKFTMFLSGTDTLVTYLRSLGARIGNTVSIRGVNALLDPDLLALADESHLGDFARLLTSTVKQDVTKQASYKPCYSFGKVEVGSRCVVGAQSVLMPGAKLQDRAILGANSVATTGSVLQEGGVYVGVDKPTMIYKQSAEGKILAKSRAPAGEVEEDDYRIREMDPLYKKLVANLAANIAKTTLSVDARYFHRLGVAGKGTLTMFSSLDDVPAHEVFAPRKSYSILVRHSNSLSGDDDARSDARGASVRILRPEAGEDVENSLLDLTLKSGKAFNCSNMLQFVNYMMKSHDERVTFVQQHPLSGIASWDSLRLPNSYTELHYYSNVARLFRPSEGSKEYFVKFRMRPADNRFGEDEGKVEPFDLIPPETGAIARSPDDNRAPRFLADDFRKRLLSAEGVRYIFSLQLRPVSEDAAGNEDALDCTKPWDDAAYPYKDVGMVHLTEILDGEVTERIRFNPINGPTSIDLIPAKTALDNASIDHGRSLAYDIAQYLRTGKPLPPSWQRLVEASDVPLQLPKAKQAAAANIAMPDSTVVGGGCPAMSGSMTVSNSVPQPMIAPSRYQHLPAGQSSSGNEAGHGTKASTDDHTLTEEQEAKGEDKQNGTKDLLTLRKVLVLALCLCMQPILQVFLPVFLLALAFYPSLIALSFVGSKAGTTWMHCSLPAAYLFSGLLFTWFSVVCRWILVGRTRDGSSKELWSVQSLRDTTWQAINVLLSNTFLELGKGSLLGSFYLRCLGATIGDSAGRVAYLDTLLALNPDLLTIGAGTAIGRNALLFGHLYEGGLVWFKATEIGQSCYVGGRALVLPGVTMENSAELTALALGMKGEVIAAY